jgi:nucleoside-diphosphate-sugar epimerase
MDDLSAYRGRRCLLTGVSGFIGSTLARTLRLTGAEFYAPRRAELDIGDAAAVAVKVRAYAPEYVFHLASDGVNQPVPDGQLWLSNVDGTRNLISALAKLPVSPRVVLLGS